MKRKVIQLAEKTLVISLPHKWVKEWKIKKGDGLEVKEKGSNIIFSTQNQRNKQKITINVEKTSERVIRWWLSSLHKKGFDEIEIFYKKEQLPLLIELLKDLFTGFAVVEQTDKRCVLQAIAQDEEQSFDNVMRRSFLVTLSIGDNLMELLEQGKHEDIEPLIQLEKTNNQLTNFCQRLINKRGLTEPTKNTFYYVIAWNLEKIADDYKYIIEHITKEKIKPKETTIELIKETNNLQRGFYEFFYEKDQKKINELHEKKKEIKEKIEQELEKEGKENIILSRLLGLLDKISDFSASMIAIHTENQ